MRPCAMVRSERDITAAGVGCAETCETDEGADCTSGPGTATGEVVLGRMDSFGAGTGLVAMLMSARFTSSIGGAGDGVTFAAVDFSGCGATMVFTTVFFGVQIIKVGTGTSSASVIFLSRSGWKSVCGPF